MRFQGLLSSVSVCIFINNEGLSKEENPRVAVVRFSQLVATPLNANTSSRAGAAVRAMPMPGAHPTNEDLNGFKRGEHVEGPHICEQYVFQAPGQTSGVWGWNDTQALYCAACGRLASDHVVLAKPTFEEIKKKPPPSLPSGYVQLRLGHRLEERGRTHAALRCAPRCSTRRSSSPLARTRPSAPPRPRPHSTC